MYHFTFLTQAGFLVQPKVTVSCLCPDHMLTYLFIFGCQFLTSESNAASCLRGQKRKLNIHVPAGWMTKRMCMVPSLITEKEEMRTYCVFVQWGQGGGAVSVQVGFFIHNVIRAHVRVIQSVPVSSCKA